MSSFPHIVGFYSFKGGVGRTLAIVNVAYLMARRGRNVLLIDMDLEAPGLGVFLRTLGELGDPAPADIIDLLSLANTITMDTDLVDGNPSAQMAFPPIQDYATQIQPERIAGGILKPQFGFPGRIDLIAVDRDRMYHERLDGLRLSTASRDHLNRIGVLLRKFFKSARISNPVPDYYGFEQYEKVPYDYVLIDSRTGNTEVGGLCFGPLSDRLVVLSGLNHQNIDSTARFLHEVGIDQPRTPETTPWDDADTTTVHGAFERLGPKPTLVVSSLVPSGEIAYKQDRIAALSKAVGVQVVVQLSYHPQMALREAIFVRDYPEEFLTIQYGVLCDQIFHMVADHPIGLLFRARLFADSNNADPTRWRPAVEGTIRLSAQSPELALPLLQQLAGRFTPRTEEDFRAADRMFRLLTQPYAPMRELSYRLWGNCLSRWSQEGQKNTLREGETIEENESKQWLTEVRYKKALEVFDAGLNLPGLLPSTGLLFLYFRGVVKENHGDYLSAYEDYTKVIDLADTPQEIRIRSMLGRGLCRGKAGDYAAAISELSAIVGMSGVPVEFKGEALWNLGITHKKSGNAHLAIDDYTKVIELPGITDERRGQAIFNRACEYLEQNKNALALNDFTSVIEHPKSILEQRIRGLLGRSDTHNAMFDTFAATVDQYAAKLLTVTTEELTQADKTIPYIRSGSLPIATEPAQRAAYDLVLSLSGLPDAVRSVTYYNRGVDRFLVKNLTESESDFSEVINLENQTPALLASALLDRAAVRDALGNKDGATRDLEKILLIPGLSVEIRARALLSLGVEKNNRGDLLESAKAFEAVLALEDVSLPVRVDALGNLGWCAYLRKEWTECVRFSREAIRLEPTHPLYRANLAFAFLHLGEVENAEVEYKRALSDVQTEEDLDRIMKDVENLLAQPTFKTVAEQMLVLLQERRQELNVNREMAEHH